MFDCIYSQKLNVRKSNDFKRELKHVIIFIQKYDEVLVFYKV